ncbi:hypothetical protein TNIN_153421, partial [Trichonephila inaurata madagascariensis]
VLPWRTRTLRLMCFNATWASPHPRRRAGPPPRHRAVLIGRTRTSKTRPRPPLTPDPTLDADPPARGTSTAGTGTA